MGQRGLWFTRRNRLLKVLIIQMLFSLFVMDGVLCAASDYHTFSLRYYMYYMGLINNLDIVNKELCESSG